MSNVGMHNKERELCLSGKGVTKVFGTGSKKVVAVDNVDFEFYQGELISIVGESGSGKTTLAKMLLDLIPVTEGQILFQGAPRDTAHTKEKGVLERHTSYLPRPLFRIQHLHKDRYCSFGLYPHAWRKEASKAKED